MKEAIDCFEKHFGTAPACTTRAPGRVELLGNHTDYNQGLVMALAVDKFIAMAAAPRDDGKVELVSTAFDAPARFAVDRIEKDPTATWADYTKGLLLQLRDRGVPLRGFNAAIHSTVPLGAGLSSSAALLVASALTMRKLRPYTLAADGTATVADGSAPPLKDGERMALAKACQAAENQFVGVNCGLLDHISSLFGRAHQVVRIDCQSLTVDWAPLPGNLAIVVCHSGVRHALVGGEYNERRSMCEAAAAKLGVAALRFVDPAGLEAARDRLTPREYECAFHIVGENDRVQRGATALAADDLTTFGGFLFDSHTSSRDSFKNSCPELDLLVELARAEPGCLGARLTGGGFGGATLNLVETDQAEGFRASVGRAYERRTGKTLESWVCDVVDGAA
jgi:galactokinase